MYSTVNGLSYFDFSRSYTQSFQQLSSQLTIVLDQVLIKAEYPANKDIVTKRTNDFHLVFADVKEIGLYEEGYQLLDADMKPYQKVAERKVAAEDVPYDLAKMNGVEVDEVKWEKNDEGLAFVMKMFIEDHTWRLEVKAAGSHETFDRFMSL